MEQAFAIIGALLMVFVLILLGGYIVNAITQMMMLKNAGHPRPWAAWVPFYSYYTLLQFGGQKPYWFWIFLVAPFASGIPYIGEPISWVASVASVVVSVYAIIYINYSFGKGQNIVLWTIFGFLLLPIWMLCLGLSKNLYQPAAGPVLFGGGQQPNPW